MVSSVTEPGLEATADAAPARRFFQLYRRGNEATSDDFVRRAAASGYEAFCFTVDSAVYSRREREITRRFAKPWRRGGAGMEFQAALNRDDIKRYKDKHSLPLIIKGIATAEDALIALEHGVEVIYVSNHGSRQLDHGLGALEILPEIVSAVAGRARIFVDGGFSRGSDIIKALALGAEAVGIGRLYCYGLAAAGEAGVIRVLELLEIEMIECLALPGVSSPAGLDRSYLRPPQPVSRPSVRAGDDVILTHAHWDHSVNWVLFPDATIWIGAEELAWAVAQPWGHTTVPELYVRELDRVPRCRRPGTILIPGHDVPMRLENGVPRYIGPREAAISAWFADDLERTTLFSLTIPAAAAERRAAE